MMIGLVAEENKELIRQYGWYPGGGWGGAVVSASNTATNRSVAWYSEVEVSRVLIFREY